MTITCKYVADDPGQILMTSLAETSMDYAFTTVWKDQLTAAGKGTTKYDRGIIVGPLVSGGGPEDFHTLTWTCGFQQRYVEVPAS